MTTDNFQIYQLALAVRVITDRYMRCNNRPRKAYTFQKRRCQNTLYCCGRSGSDDGNFKIRIFRYDIG